jgi:hypothetical protein
MKCDKSVKLHIHYRYKGKRKRFIKKHITHIENDVPVEIKEDTPKLPVKIKKYVPKVPKYYIELDKVDMNGAILGCGFVGIGLLLFIGSYGLAPAFSFLSGFVSALGMFFLDFVYRNPIKKIIPVKER